MCMCMCMCVYLYVYVHIYVVYVCVYVVYMYKSRVCMWVGVCVFMCVYLCARVYECVQREVTRVEQEVFSSVYLYLLTPTYTYADS